MFKLKNYSGYGKFGENKVNRSKVEFVNTEDEYMKRVGKPNFNRSMPLKGGYNMCVLDQTKVNQDRPVSIAQAILDKSKIIMTKFFLWSY